MQCQCYQALTHVKDVLGMRTGMQKLGMLCQFQGSRVGFTVLPE